MPQENGLGNGLIVSGSKPSERSWPFFAFWPLFLMAVFRLGHFELLGLKERSFVVAAEAESEGEKGGRKGEKKGGK